MNNFWQLPPAFYRLRWGKHPTFKKKHEPWIIAGLLFLANLPTGLFLLLWLKSYL